jgi:hypothetical protein
VKLLTVQNAKTIKGEKKGYLTGILYLAPHTLGIPEFNICPCSTVACRAACLFTAGRGRFDNVKQARLGKKNWLYNDRQGFIEQLAKDISALARAAERKGMSPCVRLNGTSDLPWHSKKYGALMTKFPDVQFYDYTKNWKTMQQAGDIPNYHLTFSYTGRNKNKSMKVLEGGDNIAAVFRDEHFPKELWGYDVIPGDETDLRFLDPAPCIVGLKAKGAAKRINSSFVLDL